MVVFDSLSMHIRAKKHNLILVPMLHAGVVLFLMVHASVISTLWMM